jgi:hypothetical protein
MRIVFVRLLIIFSIGVLRRIDVPLFRTICTSTLFDVGPAVFQTKPALRPAAPPA